MLTLFLCALPTQVAEPEQQAIEVRVDPRVELVSIVYRLSGSFEYNQESSTSPYSADVDRHFAGFADHPAVRLARALREDRGIGFNAPPSLVLHVEDLSTLRERVPFDPRPEWMDERWEPEMARIFVAVLRDFGLASRFEEFFAKHEELYSRTEERMRELLAEHMRGEWFASFFGRGAEAAFLVHPGLLLGGCNYGTGVRWPDGREELSPCIGCWKFDATGVPVFGVDVLPTVVHEFCHSFVNPLVDRHLAELEPPMSRIFPFVEIAMRDLHYPNARTVLCESLVRASVVRYLVTNEGAESARKQAQDDLDIGFAWVPELARLLGDYEAQRASTPNLDAFAPRIASFFEETAAALEKRFENAPRLVRAVPENGASDVSPDLSAIVLEFDRPMVDGSWAVMGGGDSFPPIDQTRKMAYDETGKVLSIPVTLAPDHDYRFGLNSPTKHGFKSREGVPLVPLRIEFRTKAK